MHSHASIPPAAEVSRRIPRICETTLVASLLVAGVSFSTPGRAGAQVSALTDALLDRARAAARAVPGDLPHSLRFLKFAEFKTPLSGAVEGAGDELVDGAYTVFQVRYPHGWIMVDAGVDREVETDTSVTIHQDRYQRVQEALQGANLIVVTHEHHDHVSGVIHTPARNLIAPKTVLTRAQVQTLVARRTGRIPLGSSPLIHLTPADAARYIVIDYERLYPLAPAWSSSRRRVTHRDRKWCMCGSTRGRRSCWWGILPGSWRGSNVDYKNLRRLAAKWVRTGLLYNSN